MKTRNISIATVRRLQNLNEIRKIQADLFALAQRDVLARLIDSNFNNVQIAKWMNKLGLRTATGLLWTPKSMSRLRERLDSLLRHEPFADPRQHPVKYDCNDLDTMDWMYLDRLGLLFDSVATSQNG